MRRTPVFAAVIEVALLLLCLWGCEDKIPPILPNVSDTAGTSDITENITVSSDPAVSGEGSTAESTVPETTEPSVTVSTETDTPVTDPPVTKPPVTKPPVTDPPVTDPPVTKPPVTDPPVTEPPVTEPPVTDPPVTEAPDDPPVQSGGISNYVQVSAPGILTKTCDSAVIDYSNNTDGYVMVRFTKETSRRLKVQLKGPSSTTYTYDLTPEKWAAFPLSDENGTYKITVYQNTTGSKYATVLSLTVDVKMKDEFAPFLHSNQYVDFEAAPNTIAKAASLAGNISDPLKKVEKIYDFVVNTLTYDRELAGSVKSGYLPELDKVLSKKKGICFDYAALMTGMLRSQGVPTKLVVGYAGTAYHAWISVWSEKDGWINGIIRFDGTSWQRMDPTFASSGGQGGDIMDYIGNGSNYSPKYYY